MIEISIEAGILRRGKGALDAVVGLLAEPGGGGGVTFVLKCSSAASARLLGSLVRISGPDQKGPVPSASTLLRTWPPVGCTDRPSVRVVPPAGGLLTPGAVTAAAVTGVTRPDDDVICNDSGFLYILDRLPIHPLVRPATA